MLKSLIIKSKNFFTKSSKKIVALTTTFVMLTTVMASAITVTESGPLLQYVPIKHHIYKGSRLKTYVMYANDGRLAYCLDFTKGTPSDDLQAGTKLNDAYYRALKNGYPYKSFTGDPNKDVYITQAAIWMVRGYFDGNDVGLIPSNLYPSNSDEQNIKNYAVNLFNQAISGSETPEPSISVSPKNSVAKIEGDKYVAGPFNITSLGVQDFTVELNAPDGVQVLTAEGTSKASFNGTESFYIHIPLSIEVDQVSFNVRGNVKYQAPKSYLTAQSGKQNIVVLEEFITNTVSDSAVITYNQNGSIKLVKRGDNGKLLQGVKFQLKDESGKLVGEYVTDKNGEINIPDIRKGNYIIEEVETVPGYLITTSSSDIVVTPGKTTSLEVVNKEITGELELTKTDISDGKLLPNTEFTIRNSKGEVVKTGITDENGIAKFNLTYGKYTYQETKAPEGYILDNKEYPFEILEDGEIIKATMTNERIKGNIELLKIDAETNEPVPGVSFEIECLEGCQIGKIFEVISNDEGIAALNNLEYGKYRITEVKAAEGYVLDSTPMDFEIRENNELIELKMLNRKIKGKLEIIKVDNLGVKKLQGAEFGIYDKDKNLIEVITTDENGSAITSDLNYGQYYYRELKSPDGYVVDGNFYEFKVEEDNVIKVVKFKNYPVITYKKTIEPKEWNKTYNSTVPKTGDNMNVGISLLALVMSGIFIITVGRKKK